MAIELSNPQWRDAHIDTIEDWCPEFKQFAIDAAGVLEAYESLCKRYWEHLAVACPNDKPDDIAQHIIAEANMWLVNRMDRIAAEVATPCL